MRLFIAINIPESIKDYFVSVQQRLDTNNAKIKLVNKYQIHITLKFIGEVKEENVEFIRNVLSQIRFEPFSVRLAKIGIFPSEKYIKVIWVGINPAEKIIEIQKQIDNKLISLFKKDKRFHPHITLGRVKFVKDKKEFIKSLKDIKIEKKRFEIKEFKLIKSTLTKKHPVYEDLAIFNER
jgi:2'-5' RNA ligase